MTFFFRRAAVIGRALGFLSTTSVKSGDTRSAALDPLVAGGWKITRAVAATPWPGSADVTISKVWMASRDSGQRPVLDGEPVGRISTSLTAVGEDDREPPPYRLARYSNDSFQGSKLDGVGFTLTPSEARRILHDDPKAKDVLKPYLSGDDLNGSPAHTPSRFVIDFGDWPLERAARYPSCLAIVEEKVRPVRASHKRAAHRERWWHYGDKRPALYRAIAGMERVLVMTLHRNTMPAFVATGSVISHAMVVFAYDDYFHFGVLSSAFHTIWALKYGSTISEAPRYTPSDVFDTFPQPDTAEAVAIAGEALDGYRAQHMLSVGEGLTTTYQRLNDPAEGGAAVLHLRELHSQLDAAVSDAYGWSDIDLEPGFHSTPSGLRWTIGPTAQAAVLSRLLTLNHARYAEEIRLGLHDKKKPTAKSKGPASAAAGQLTLSGHSPSPEAK